MTEITSWSEIEAQIPKSLEAVDELIKWHKMTIESLEKLQDELQNKNANGKTLPVEYIDIYNVQDYIWENTHDWTSKSVYGSKDQQNEAIVSEHEQLIKLHSLIENLPNEDK